MPKALGLVETRGLVAAIEAADAMVKTSNVTLIGKEVTRPALITIKIVGDVAAVKASVDAGAAAAAKVGELVSIHVIPQPDSQITALFPEITDDDASHGSSKPKPERRRKTSTEKPAGRSKPVIVEEDSISEIPAEVVEPKAGKTEPEEIPTPAETSAKPGQAGKTEPEEAAEEKPPPSKKETKSKAKPRTPKQEKKSEDENLFSVKTDHLERLRREALGIKESKEEKEAKPAGKSAPETSAGSPKIKGLKMEELEKLNVHNLRKTARATEGFPIQGREISRANRRELLDLFKKLI